MCHATTDLRKHIHKAGFGPLPEEVLENYKHLVIEFSLCGLELGVPLFHSTPSWLGDRFQDSLSNLLGVWDPEDLNNGGPEDKFRTLTVFVEQFLQTVETSVGLVRAHFE